MFEENREIQRKQRQDSSNNGYQPAKRTRGGGTPRAGAINNIGSFNVVTQSGSGNAQTTPSRASAGAVRGEIDAAFGEEMT